MEDQNLENIVVILNDKVDASGEPIIPKNSLHCTFCNWKFSSKQNLKRHVKEQHLGFRFPCNKCEAEFGRKEDIIKHYSVYHSDDLQEIRYIKQVPMVAEDGQVKPRVKAPGVIKIPPKKIKKEVLKVQTPIQRPRRNRNPKEPQTKVVSSPAKTTQSPAKTVVLPASSRECIDTGTSSEPERVVIALDPVTQFRLERVIADRVNMITENVVIETLSEGGNVTKREKIERKYHLNPLS
ncbi:uncharacterized protein [Asterias amurensis]|uniref:uncharacterized protein n=1 Tax=Asterias amurensis TaxID=7602 RepID=UPI003AB8964D